MALKCKVTSEKVPGVIFCILYNKIHTFPKCPNIVCGHCIYKERKKEMVKTECERRSSKRKDRKSNRKKRRKGLSLHRGRSEACPEGMTGARD